MKAILSCLRITALLVLILAMGSLTLAHGSEAERLRHLFNLPLHDLSHHQDELTGILSPLIPDDPEARFLILSREPALADRFIYKLDYELPAAEFVRTLVRGICAGVVVMDQAFNDHFIEAFFPLRIKITEQSSELRSPWLESIKHIRPVLMGGSVQGISPKSWNELAHSLARLLPLTSIVRKKFVLSLPGFTGSRAGLDPGQPDLQNLENYKGSNLSFALRLVEWVQNREIVLSNSDFIEKFMTGIVALPARSPTDQKLQRLYSLLELPAALFERRSEEVVNGLVPFVPADPRSRYAILRASRPMPFNALNNIDYNGSGPEFTRRLVREISMGVLIKNGRWTLRFLESLWRWRLPGDEITFFGPTLLPEEQDEVIDAELVLIHTTLTLLSMGEQIPRPRWAKAIRAFAHFLPVTPQDRREYISTLPLSTLARATLGGSYEGTNEGFAVQIMDSFAAGKVPLTGLVLRKLLDSLEKVSCWGYLN